MSASKITQIIIKILHKNLYLPDHMTHRDYNWTICEELLLFRLSKIVFIQYENF